MKNVRTALISLLLLTVAACAPAAKPVMEPDNSQGTEAVTRLAEQYAAAMNAGDAAALAGLFANDGVLMPPNESEKQGSQMIQAWYEATLSRFTAKHSIRHAETGTAGDWAFARGTYTIQFTPKAEGEPMEDEGKYIVICQRQVDGTWKLTRLIWNSNHIPTVPAD